MIQNIIMFIKNNRKKWDIIVIVNIQVRGMDSIIELADKDEKKKHKQLYSNDLKFEEGKQPEQYPLNLEYFTSDLIFEELIKNIEGVQKNEQIKSLMGQYMEECKKVHLLDNNGQLDRLFKIVMAEIEQLKKQIEKKLASLERKNRQIQKLSLDLSILNHEISEYKKFMEENPCEMAEYANIKSNLETKANELDQVKRKIMGDIESLYQDIVHYAEKSEEIKKYRDSLILKKKDKLSQLDSSRKKNFQTQNQIQSLQVKVNERKDEKKSLEEKQVYQLGPQAEFEVDRRGLQSKGFIFQKKVKMQRYYFPQEPKENNCKLYVAIFIIIFLLIVFINPTKS